MKCLMYNFKGIVRYVIQSILYMIILFLLNKYLLIIFQLEATCTGIILTGASIDYNVSYFHVDSYV